MRVETFTPESPRYAEFLAFAAELYADDPYWRAPTDPAARMHPLCFLASSAGRIVARACLTSVSDEWRLGWYECIDDADAARALLDAVRERVRARDGRSVLGPINGTTWHRYRFADPAPAPPFFLDVHHKPYYAAQWLACGAVRIDEYSSTSFDSLDELPEHDAHVEAQRRRGITLRQFRPDRFDEELRLLHTLSLAGFASNRFYSPIDLEEFVELYEPLRPIVRPELVLFAEENGAPVGFVFAVDNLYERERRSLVMKSATVIPEYAGRGLGHLLLETIHRTASAQGYDQIIHALIHRGNRSGSILAERSRLLREYAVYALPL
jgi:GNAT superfamily N-acetyltransferase